MYFTAISLKEFGIYLAFGIAMVKWYTNLGYYNILPPWKHFDLGVLRNFVLNSQARKIDKIH